MRHLYRKQLLVSSSVHTSYVFLNTESQFLTNSRQRHVSKKKMLAKYVLSLNATYFHTVVFAVLFPEA